MPGGQGPDRRGYNTNFGFNGFHQTSDAITANAPSPSRSGAWAVKSSSGGATTAYALRRQNWADTPTA